MYVRLHMHTYIGVVIDLAVCVQLVIEILLMSTVYQ